MTITKRHTAFLLVIVGTILLSQGIVQFVINYHPDLRLLGMFIPGICLVLGGWNILRRT